MQDYLVLVSAAAAAAYLLRRAWRTWARGDCAGCCEKGAAQAAPLIPASALLGRVKGRSLR